MKVNEGKLQAQQPKYVTGALITALSNYANVQCLTSPSAKRKSISGRVGETIRCYGKLHMERPRQRCLRMYSERALRMFFLGLRTGTLSCVAKCLVQSLRPDCPVLVTERAGTNQPSRCYSSSNPVIVPGQCFLILYYQRYFYLPRVSVELLVA